MPWGAAFSANGGDYYDLKWLRSGPMPRWLKPPIIALLKQ